VKILLAAEKYPPVVGGGETHVHRLAECLAARGHELTVVTRRHRHVVAARRGQTGPRARAGPAGVVRARRARGPARAAPVPAARPARTTHWNQARLFRSVMWPPEAVMPAVEAEENLSDSQLADYQVRTLFHVDDSGRLLAINDVGDPPPAYCFLSATDTTAFYRTDGNPSEELSTALET
jgi:hypothetical protein